MAGYHDEFEEYFNACAHRACQSPTARALIRQFFLQCHPNLVSPEVADPRPVVTAFCRRVLYQLDQSPPDPLSDTQLAALLLPDNHKLLAGQGPPADLALRTAVQTGLDDEPTVIGNTGLTTSAVLQVYAAHMRFLRGLFPGLPATTEHARAFTVAALTQLRAFRASTDSHAGRPTRRAARGGKQ